MSDDSFDVIETPKKPRASFLLRLASLKSTRQTFARLLREYAAGRVDRDTFRDLCYGLGGFLAVFSKEIDNDFDDRLTKIEERL